MPFGAIAGGLLGALGGLMAGGSSVQGRDYDINNTTVTPRTQWYDEYKKYSDYNSNYYKTAGNQLSRQLTGAMSPNSILALVTAQGGSMAQAQEQMKAMRGRISDQTFQGVNQMYLQGAQLGQNALQQDFGLRQQQIQNRLGIAQQNDTTRNSFANSLLGLGGGMLGNFLGGLGGSKSSPGAGYLGSQSGGEYGSNMNTNFQLPNKPWRF